MSGAKRAGSVAGGLGRRVVTGLAVTVALMVAAASAYMAFALATPDASRGDRLQGVVIIGLVSFMSSPVFGVITAIHVRAGLVLSALYLLGLVGLYIRVAVELW